MNHLRERWRERIAIAYEVGIPIENLQRESIGYSGRVGKGYNPVTGYRGFGTWTELKDAIRTGKWISKGSFTVPGEGDTQFALRMQDVLHNSVFHPLRGSGFLGVVEADLSGLPFETHLGGYNRQGRKTDSLVLSPDGRSGILYPDTGLGIGIVGGVPWRQIVRIYEVENERITNSWERDEWERHIDKLKDNPAWYPPNRADPLSQRVWVTWAPNGLMFHHDLNDGRSSTACGWKTNSGTDHKLAPLRDVANGTAAGKNARGQKMKPCPKCWPEFAR